MSQPLGLAAGNALEVVEAIETLHGRGPADFRQHCVDVAAEMLLIAGACTRPRRLPGAAAAATLDDGTAWAKFREWIAAQGGDLRGRGRSEPPAQRADRRAAARAARRLRGADRRARGGLHGGGPGRRPGEEERCRWTRPWGSCWTERGKIGGKVEAGEPLLWVHARTQETLDAALARLAAYASRTRRSPRRRWCIG